MRMNNPSPDNPRISLQKEKASARGVITEKQNAISASVPLCFMNTICQKQLSFGSLFGKQVTAHFNGGHITADAGGLLLRELDERYGVTEEDARCLGDRSPLLISAS